MNFKKIISILTLTLSVFAANSQSTFTMEVGADGFTHPSIIVELGDQVNFALNLSTANGAHSSTSTNIPVGAVSWDYTMTCSSCLYSVIATKLGVYEFTDSNSGLSGEFIVVEQGTAGINEKETASYKFNIYPNPASQNEGINIDYDIDGIDGKIIISDITGKVIQSIPLLTTNGTITLVNNLQSGIYFYSILNSKELIKTKKIVIK